MEGSAAISSVSFHRKTFGQNIQLEDSLSKATRHTSFDNGITFTNKQVQINERIHLKIIDVDESGQWLGSLALGFTQIDPATIQKKELCKSALPNLCQKTGTSYVKRIFESLKKQIIITFYFNKDGAYYILDGREQELYKNIDAKQPLWGVIDIYGNVKGVVFTTQPKTTIGGQEFFAKYPEKPDKLPIKYFTQLKPTDLQPISFVTIHGPELELYCQDKVALRRNVQKLERPYLFIDLQMTPGDELYIRVLSVHSNYRTSAILGFTNANPNTFAEHFEKLPTDPAALVDRNEFWILCEDPFDEKLSELDEYRIVFDKTGHIYMLRNNQSMLSAKTLVHTDPDIPFYPFLFLNGRLTALSVFGLISPHSKHNEMKVDKPSTKKVEDDEDSGLCKICYETKVDCVLIPCGHMFFCLRCKEEYEKTTAKKCPTCRKPYEEAFKIAAD